MISSTELRRLAGAWNIDVTVVERDYMLSWALAGLYGQPQLAQPSIGRASMAWAALHTLWPELTRAHHDV